MSTVAIDIHADSRYPIDRKLVRQSISVLVEQYLGVGRNILVDVSITGSRKIRELNKKYRNIDAPTDVLSFPLEEKDPGPDGILRLGDIIVNYPEAMRMAILMNRLIDKVIVDLVEHGLKHLLGEHHPE